MRSGYHEPSLNAHCPLIHPIDSKIMASDALVVAVDGGNPSDILLCKAQRLALPRKGRNLWWQPWGRPAGR